MNMNTITLSKSSDFGEFYEFAQDCNFKEAIKAFQLSKKSFPSPMYALLERACTLITSETEALKVYELATQEGAEYQDVAYDATERYDELTKDLVSKMLIDFSDRSDLHLRKASNYYKNAPSSSRTKVEMLKFMEQICFYVFEKQCIRLTEFRIKVLSDYLPGNELDKYKKQAVELLEKVK